MLQVLYKLKTAKIFDRNRSKEDKGSSEVSDEDPFAIQIMAWCPESRMLCVAGVSANVIIYRFSKLEVTTEVVQVRSSCYFCFKLGFLTLKVSSRYSSSHCIPFCSSYFVSFLSSFAYLSIISLSLFFLFLCHTFLVFIFLLVFIFCFCLFIFLILSGFLLFSCPWVLALVLTILFSLTFPPCVFSFFPLVFENFKPCHCFCYFIHCLSLPLFSPHFLCPFLSPSICLISFSLCNSFLLSFDPWFPSFFSCCAVLSFSHVFFVSLFLFYSHAILFFLPFIL